MRIHPKKFDARWAGLMAAMFAFLFAIPAHAEPNAAKPISLSIGIGGVYGVRDLAEYIDVIYRYLIGAAFVLCAFDIAYGGFAYVSSGGIPKLVESAKKRITDGLIALLLLVGSFVVLNTISPDFVKLRMPEIGQVKKINLNPDAKRCGDYKTKSDCETDPSKIGKETKGCQWITPVGTSVCVGKQIIGGKNGGACRSEKPLCDEGLECVHSIPSGGGGFQNVCTDGKIGSPCDAKEPDGRNGCDVLAMYTCDKTTNKCVSSAKKDDGVLCGADGECKSKICYGGRCADSNNLPKRCADQADCTAGAKKDFADKGMFCCTKAFACSSTVPEGFCTSYALLGEACKSNLECFSQVCSKSGSCLGEDGEDCAAGADCKNGACNLLEGSTTEKVCGKPAEAAPAPSAPTP